jgi:amino acid adenylation domain-containing protein
MFNKNDDDIPKMEYTCISIIKSKIDYLTSKHDLDQNLLFLAATCITLTKYINSTQIFIKTKSKINEKSIEVPLKFNDANRKRNIIDYIANIRNDFSNPKDYDESLKELANQSHFNYIYNDFEDNDSNTSLIIGESSRQYLLKLKFNANKYTFSYAHSFLRSIKRVLNQFVACGISNLKVEDIALRDEKPPIKYELKRNPLVNELLESQANKTPEKVALITCGKEYTFKQINDEANRIANALIKRGIEKGSTISLMLARDKTLITTFLGIIKAGCVAVPLDINFPPERISYIRKNSDSEYIITRQSLDGAIDPQDLIDDGDIEFPEVDLKADDPIFLLYTSGSTGNPKGVISTHCGISNLTATHIKNNYKRLLSIASISFDISEEDILLSLTNDMELVFANDDEIKDVVLLANLLEKTRPEFVNLTPSSLLSYLQVPEFKSAIRHFKGIGCGGEPFTRNIYDSIKECADIEIYNGYGPLETSMTSNSKKILNPDFITNGKPLFNYVTDVRDIDGKLLPYGVIGQLYIGGIGVSKGYYNMEEKTKEVFITLNELPYYKSGDYAVELPSGEIIIKGRTDNQIKLRGQRVDPEEIGHVIVRYGEINNSVVIIHEINNENHLCAYFTCESHVDIDDLREYLERFLSEYMVPTFIIQLDSFPETPSGKIDRKMLPKPAADTENVKPADDLEKTVYDFCRDILNHDSFGVTDNLFKLGFTSLTLMKLNSDIYHEFNINLKHNDLMNNPTVRKLSKLIGNNASTDEIEKVTPSVTGKYPMSSQQKRLYVIYRKNPDLTNYNLPNVFRLKKPIDIVKLEDAINRVINAEEILRTSLHVEDGEYIQKIHNDRPIKVDSIKLEKNEDIYEAIAQYIQPFRLETDSLLRIKVIKFNGKNYIFRDMHHVIGDQISNDLLYDKIKKAYNDKPFTTNKIQYKDYALWVKNQQAKEADYWKNKKLSEYGTVLMTDYERPVNMTFNGSKIAYNLDKEIIEKQARDNTTTVYKLLLLQFCVLLHKYTDESNIQIGTVTSGRTHPVLKKTLGMFVNTLPFAQNICGRNTLKETLMKTEEELANLFSNQDYSIEQIVEDNNIQTNNSFNPLFSIAFIQNTTNDLDNDFKWDGSKFDLTCTIKNSPSDLTVEFDYNSDLYSFEKIKGLLDHYINLIDTISENMGKKIEDIDILSSCERERIMEMAGVSEDVKYDSIMTALKKQIAKNPAMTILSDCKSSLSYNDFNLKTNSLANYLKDNFAVEDQDNIVLIANRSIESVLGFYSILKLNAIYVPVNPSAPEGRIMHIIEEVGAKVILTNLDLDMDGVNIVDLNQKSLYDYDYGELESSSQGKLCILHTSGTTGVPKGVQITHENVENFLINAKKQFYDKDSRIFYHTTNLGFDTSLFEIIFSILNGIRLHVIDETYDFSGIPEDVLNQKSIVNTVPAKLKMFLTLPNFERIMENVRQLILAGESLNEGLVAEIRKKYNPSIYNAYGPCEATIFASIKRVLYDKITIGKANLNTQIYILNNERQLCPIGIPGELCIGGKQVADGYLNNDDETNRHFITNPFDEGTLYCTGDLAYLDSDGEINFIGRKDTQIKINGQRIEVDEINRQIEMNEDIIQAVTVSNSGNTQLYSYIVSDDVIDTDEILDDLENVLLPFMLPSSIMQIDSIPLNNNGKIDIKRLPQPKAVKYKYSAPTNIVEEAIVNVWENVLDVKRIGINDNFYRLGGDSIKAIRIVSMLQNEGINCNPSDLLNYKTPYLLAQNAGNKFEETYEYVEGVFDLLPIQDYFFDQINRNNFTQEFVLKSAADLDISILQAALDELTNLHDMLRARFKVKDDRHVQEILPLNTQVCEINEYEINGDFDEDIAEIIRKAKDSLDVFNNLVDVSLVRYEDKCYLVFVIHHLIVDGVSWSILLDDLTYIYTHLASDRKMKLDKPNSYESWLEDVKNSTKNIFKEKDSLFDDSTIICPLSEVQLGIYLDEKVNNMNTAYSTYAIIDCGSDSSIEEIEMAILSVIDKHPILKARLLDNDISPLLICDSNPDINISSDDDPSNLVKAFDLEKSLSRFNIIDKNEEKKVFFEAHHIINDAVGCTIVERELINALEDNLDEGIDLGFVHASYDSFKSKFESGYEQAHEFYASHLADIDEVKQLSNDSEGCEGDVSITIQGIKSCVEEFASANGITAGIFLNASFAYTYSRFLGSDKVYFNFTEHGRHEDYARNAVGMFTRTVPILVDCKNDYIKGYLNYFSDLALSSMLNDVYPFRALASEFNLNNEVMFEYNLDFNDVSSLNDGITASKNITDSISDLLCVVNDLDDGYAVRIQHSDKFSRKTIISFAKAYAEILNQMMDREMLTDIDYCNNEDLKQFSTISPYENSQDIYGNENHGDTSVDYVAPTNAVESMVADAFEVVFNQEIIGLNDDFIDLGGDSIKAIRVISLLNKNGIICPARDILNYRTPYRIAQNIENTQDISSEIIESNELTIKEAYHDSNEESINLTRPYSYMDWVEDVNRLVDNISKKEKLHWIEMNGQLDDSQIRGKADGFNFNVEVGYDTDNLLMISEEEYWALAIARAYKKTYRKDIIFNRESYGRDDSLANLFRTVGWFTSQYPVPVDIGNDYDDVSIVKDVYKIKKAFGDVKNLGLNYASLIYITNELEYKHCPVTFNFLSTEFAFEDELFKSINHKWVQDDLDDADTYGIVFNINRMDDFYYISGDYPKDTYIADNLTEFLENIRFELEFIGNFTFNDNEIVCALSEPQLEVYFNEKDYDMGNAYSTWEIIECPLDKSIDEIKNTIHSLIEKHPILKGRIFDDRDMPLLICDSYPLVEVCNTNDFTSLINPFDLERYLARFFIIDNEKTKHIVYDIHHVINDAIGYNIIGNDFTDAFDGILNKDVDLGFLYASRDSFESKFKATYDSSHEFYSKQLKDISEVGSMKKDSKGSQGIVSLPIRGIRSDVEEFTRNNNITIGTFLNAIFAYAYSRFIGSPKVYYNFVEHGRHENYIQDSLGMFARTTPILVDCKNDDIKTYLEYFSDLVLNSMMSNVYPFRLLEKEFNLNNIVLFEYNFDLNDVSYVGNDIIVRDTFKDSFSEFFCVINDLDDGYVIHINHADMFSSDTAVRFVRLYARILTQILDNKNLDDIT